MILALFTLACFAVSFWLGLEARSSYRQMCQERFSDNSVDVFGTKMISFAGCSIFAPASLVLSIVSISNDGHISNEWSTTIAISFTLLGAFCIALVCILRLAIEKMHDQTQGTGLDKSNTSRAN